MGDFCPFTKCSADEKYNFKQNYAVPEGIGCL